MDNALPQGRARHFLADVDLVDLGLDGDVLHVQAHGKRDAGARLYQTHALLLNQDRIRRGLSGTKFAQVYQNSLLNLKGKNEEKKKKKKDSCIVRGTNSLATSDRHPLTSSSFNSLLKSDLLSAVTVNTFSAEQYFKVPKPY